MIDTVHRIVQLVDLWSDGVDPAILVVWWDQHGRHIAGPMLMPNWLIEMLTSARSVYGCRTIYVWAGPAREWPTHLMRRERMPDDVLYVQDCGPRGLQLVHRTLPGIAHLASLDHTHPICQQLWAARREPCCLAKIRSCVAPSAEGYVREYRALCEEWLAQRNAGRPRSALGGESNAKCE